jgi:hypothetical protein
MEGDFGKDRKNVVGSVTKKTSMYSWVHASGIAALLAAVAFFLIPGHAEASVPQIGTLVIPGSGGGTALPKTPVPTIADQTTVEVKVPANSTLTPGASVKILECADGDGMADDLPVSAAYCDGLTINVGTTIDVASDGSVDKTDYTIYILPSVTLHEPSDQTTECTATSACVLYIGQDQNDFAQPHVWSQPFYAACPSAASATCGASTKASAATTTSTTSVTSAASTGDASGNGAGSVGTGADSPPGQLAATGAAQALPWMTAGGVLLLLSGSIGRRRLSTSRA